MKIVFVCTGNVCRSPFCESVLRKALSDRGRHDILVDSYGTEDTGGMERDETVIRIAAQMGYEVGGQAKYMDHPEINDADLILTMNKTHRDMLTRFVRYDHWDRIHTFSEYVLGDPEVVISDPHFQSESVYQNVLRVLEEGCRKLADMLCKEDHP